MRFYYHMLKKDIIFLRKRMRLKIINVRKMIKMIKNEYMRVFLMFFNENESHFGIGGRWFSHFSNEKSYKSM